MDRDNRGASIDFTGTSSQLNSNFNALKAITMPAVLYVFVIETPGEGGSGEG